MPRSCISSWSWWKILEGHWFVKCLFFSEGVMLSQNVLKINLPNVITSPLLLPWEILRDPDPERFWILDDFCGFTWLYHFTNVPVALAQRRRLRLVRQSVRPGRNETDVTRCFFENTQFVTQFERNLSPFITIIYIYILYYVILYYIYTYFYHEFRWPKQMHLKHNPTHYWK